MSRKMIYQSPKPDKLRSSPISEDNRAARKRLEERGWRIVEVLDDDAMERSPEPASESTPDQLAEGLSPAGDLDSRDTQVFSPVPTETAINESDWLDHLDFLSEDQRDGLRLARLNTIEAIRNASDADLRAVRGVGASTVKHLRATAEDQAQ